MKHIAFWGIFRMIALYMLALFQSGETSVTFDEVSGWLISRRGESCSMTSSYENGAFLNASMYVHDTKMYFIVGDDSWDSIQRDDEFRIDVQIDNYDSGWYVNSARGTRVGDAGAISFNFSQPDFIGEFMVGSTMTISRNQLSVISLSLSGTRAAVGRMADCIRSIRQSEDFDPFADRNASASPSTRSPNSPTPRGNPGSWVTTNDYPSSALRERAEGRVSFKLTITESGLISNCEITESSGHARLDETTCRLLRRRARFSPALDRSGNPTAGEYSSFVDWAIPN